MIDRRKPRPHVLCATLLAPMLAGGGPGVARAQVGISAPTAVDASDGAYRDHVAITWDAIRGATAYRVFRATTPNPATAVDLGTSVSWLFIDHDAVLVPGTTYHYWVRAENAGVSSPLGGPDTGSLAVGGPPGPAPPLAPPLAPPGSPVTAAKVTLGKLLFWDEQLSSTRTVACGTCHRGAEGGADPRAVLGRLASTNPGPDGAFGTSDDVTGSPGVPQSDDLGLYGWEATFGMNPQVTGRLARPAIDAGYSRELFWDGRAGERFEDPLSGQTILPAGAALESQSMSPPVGSAEMAHVGRDWNDVATRVATSRPLALAFSIPSGLSRWIGGRGYPAIFQEVFGSPDVTPARIGLAIAAYERTLYSDRTPFDRFLAGIAPLPPTEQAGFGLFNQLGCAGCHGGPVLSDQAYHYIGVRPTTAGEDLGRFGVTGQNGDRGRFRTAELRNVGLRGPYMHTGSLGTIDDVIGFYDRGGDFNAPNKDPRIRPLGLSGQQKTALREFLARSLTDPRVASETYPFDRPSLYTESGCVPFSFGAGAGGSGGVVPAAVALEPPLLGNPSFTVGVVGGLGGAKATLVIADRVPPKNPPLPGQSFARLETVLQGQGPGQGFGSVSLAIAADPALNGRKLFGRWYVSDPSAPFHLASSRPFRIALFGPYPTDGNGNGTVDICEVSTPTGLLEPSH